MRLGIGHPGKDLVLHYVLQNFLPDETVWIDKQMPAIAEALPLMLAGQESAFMSKVALLMDPPQRTLKEQRDADTARAAKTGK